MSEKITAAQLEAKVMDLINDTIIASPEDAMRVAQTGAAVHIFAASRMRRASPKLDEMHSLLLRGIMWMLDAGLAKESKHSIAGPGLDDELELFVSVLGAALWDRCCRAEDTDPAEVFAAFTATAAGVYIIARTDEQGDDIVNDPAMTDKSGARVEEAVDVFQKLIDHFIDNDFEPLDTVSFVVSAGDESSKTPVDAS